MGGKTTFSKARLDGLKAGSDPKELVAGVKWLRDRISKLETLRGTGDEFGGAFDPEGLGKIDADLNPAKRMASIYKELVAEQQRFFKEGGAFYDELNDGAGRLGDAFRDVSEASKDWYGNARDGRIVMGDLYKSFKGFVGLSKGAATTIGKTATALKNLGLDTQTFGKILDTAALAYGQNEKEIVGLGAALMEMRQEFKIAPAELAQNFQTAQKTLHYTANKMMAVFKKLQHTSRTTGVSFDTLTSAFGNSMDTFQGSSTAAGKLNAILGRSVFNSMDLLRKTESERMSTILKGVRQHIGGDLNKMGKFEIKAIADAMGLSPEDARRLLSGKTDIKKLMSKRIKDPKKEQATAFRNLKEATEAAEEGLSKMVGIIKGLMTPAQKARIELSAGLADRKMTDFGEILLQQVTGLSAQDLKTQMPQGLKGGFEYMNLVSLLATDADAKAALQTYKDLDPQKKKGQGLAQFLRGRQTAEASMAAGDFSDRLIRFFTGATPATMKAFTETYRLGKAKGGQGTAILFLKRLMDQSKPGAVQGASKIKGFNAVEEVINKWNTGQQDPARKIDVPATKKLFDESAAVPTSSSIRTARTGTGTPTGTGALLNIDTAALANDIVAAAKKTGGVKVRIPKHTAKGFVEVLIEFVT